MKERLIRITEEVIAAAIAVHRALGPGLLESAYEACLAHELAARGLAVERQKGVPVNVKILKQGIRRMVNDLQEKHSPRVLRSPR